MEKNGMRNRLQDLHLSYTWLINMMALKGVKVDKTTLSSAVNGTITGERAVRIVNLGNEILDEYERYYLRSVEP